MVIEAKNARDCLFNRLKAVFAADVFGALYDGANAPNVYKGLPLNEPPFYVSVDDTIDTIETAGAASMGHAEVKFTISIWAQVVQRDRAKTADTLLAYLDVIFAAILADQQLNGAVDNSFPNVTVAGIAADDSKRYLGAASVEVECTCGSVCPAEIREAVENANGN